MKQLRELAEQRKRELELREKQKAEQEAEQLRTGQKVDLPIQQPRIVRSPSRRSLMITKDIEALELPNTVKMRFPKQGDQREIEFLVSPDEGYWKTGNFLFNVKFPPEYNYQPPVVKCLTKVYHPQIDFNTSVCMSTLRMAKTENDGGWTATRGLVDIIQNIICIFLDPDGSDALNVSVGNMMMQNRDQFEKNVKASMLGQRVGGEAFEKQPIQYDFPTSKQEAK
ncbi:MAG: putative NEDD8-conjugating enzyme Ubc12 [Streblomastix strix]|uniref:Putative NEDD8-conjugating enzyme Ubc12 n=1 Tax=Streblomastix strix TaxID=222440 RepID=A0A5J4VLU6_9EUKA|nr:MAG: putative NEDD8-conjugating enzyme Ubc12 [Streblomastix strix]